MEGCIHHWLIPASGVYATGECRNCHATREFMNTLPDGEPGDTMPERLPSRIRAEMRANERAALALVFAGHERQNYVGRIG